MAVKPAWTPFETEFGGCKIVQKDADWLYCVEKNMKIRIESLKAALKTISKVIGHKETIGMDIVTPPGKGRQFAHIWRDEFNTHIECLSEPTVEFNKKYQKLIKHLNNR